jgi:hypothetical protein
MMDVWVAYFNDDDDFTLIGVARTIEEAQTLAERWAVQNNVRPSYGSWSLTDYGWTRYELFIRNFWLPDKIAP